MDIPQAANAAAKVLSSDLTTATVEIQTMEGKVVTYYKAHVPPLAAGAGLIVGVVLEHFLKF